jgi:cobalt-zinc-cadmium efflux system outer membrane protein
MTTLAMGRFISCSSILTRLPAQMARTIVFVLALFVAALALGCASAGGAPGRGEIADALQRRAGATIRAQAGAPSLPPGVSLDDGLTQEEAVATALWNSAAFEASLTDLGIARADLVEAGLLRNPVLSLLFPWGPKQFEWTLQMPLDALWQRPRRVAAASLAAQVVGERLVSRGLALVGDVRRAHVDAVAAEQRVALGAEHASLTRRLAEIADARLRAGDISELEARAARSDAAQMDAALRALEHDRDIARVTLFTQMGIDPPASPLQLTAPAASAPASCGTVDVLTKEALASRPDVRAAEIGIESAGSRASWERTRVVSLIALLDANSQGKEGYEMGPGLTPEIPLFSRNQGGIQRAEAELERASRAYVALRLQVGAEIRTSAILVDRARQALDIWEKDILPSLQIEQRQAESAYKAGEVALLSLLDVNRRLVQARSRALDTRVELEKAAATLDQIVGRTCVAEMGSSELTSEF